MQPFPQFPNFKHLDLGDRDFIQDFLWTVQPETSEWTFTNLFIWRLFNRTRWAMLDDSLVILCHPEGYEPYFFQPMGGDRVSVSMALLDWMKRTTGQNTSIERVDEKLAASFTRKDGWNVVPIREQFDYLYPTADLIGLAGRKYHAKKNRINRVEKSVNHRYEPLTADLVHECIRVLIQWCNWRECHKSTVMRAEFGAVHEALLEFEPLKLTGGVLFVSDEIKAFSLGELLNDSTAVIHVEKVDPEIPDLFAVINQRFCEKAWNSVQWINREQDLGEPGLRKAKLSYHPAKLVEKYRISRMLPSVP
jgi:uncharacterized protein